MKSTLTGTTLLMIVGVTCAEPVVYTDESSFLAAVAALELSAIHESFEDDIVWADSRNSIVEPGSTPTVTSQGLVWTSNHVQNDIATGDVGGSAPDGTFAIYSLPHGVTDDSGLYCDQAEDPVPIECFQDDGLMVQSAAGDMLYAFGGRIDTANSGKVSFLLDGVDINANDIDNIDNWQREGEWADSWSFVGVIDTDGFHTVELKELRGKDTQQVLLFADDFSIGVAAVSVPVAGSVTGAILRYTYCKNLDTGSAALDPVAGRTGNWNCTDNGLAAASGERVIALMSGTGVFGATSLSGSMAGVNPVIVSCINGTTGQQTLLPLAGSHYWDCQAGGFVSQPGDAVRILLYATAP